MLSNLFKPNVEELKAKRNVKGLIKALRNRDSSIRGDAATTLGEIGSEEAVGPLIATLRDVHHYPRACAFESLIKSGKANSEEVYSSLRSLSEEQLGELLHGDDTAVRVLRASGAPISLEKLIKTTRLNCGDELLDWVVSHGKKAVDQLLPALEALENWESEHDTIAVLLGRLGDKRAVRPLIKLLRHKLPGVRQAAAEALGLLVDRSAIKPLRRLLADESTYVINSSHTALKKLGWEPATEDDRMHLALVSEDAAAFESIGPKAIEFLKDIVRKGSLVNRDFAASFLARKDPQILREAWWDGKIQRFMNRSRKDQNMSQYILDKEKDVLCDVLADIEHYQDHTLFVVTGLRSIPEFQSIIEALVPNLHVYTWSGVIGQKGINEKLAELCGVIESQPEKRYLIWGPGSQGLRNQLNEPQPRLIVYFGNEEFGYDKTIQ